MILLGSISNAFVTGQNDHENQITNFSDNTIEDNFVNQADPNRVLLYYYDQIEVTRLQNSLSVKGLAVDLMNYSINPTIAQLMNYTVIVLLSSIMPVYSDTFGDILADYVDQGGNLIALAYSFVGLSSIGGRLNSSTYFPLITTSEINITRNYIPESAHPSFNGVTSFTANNSLDVSITSNASVIASYADSMELAVIKDNIIFLNTWYGGVSYQIDNIIANSIKFLSSTKVLIFYNNAILAEELQFGLFFTGFRADLITSNSIPTLSELNKYTVLIWISSSALSNPDSVGNIFADYIDQGGYFITLAYGYVGPWGIGGRLNSSGYFPFTAVANNNIARTYDKASNHSIFNDVVYFNTDQSMNVNVTSGSTVVAYYDDGMELAAIKDNVFALNTFYGESYGSTDLIISNAIYILRGMPVTDLTAPMIFSSFSHRIYEGTTDNTISWVLKDDNPSFYSILREGVVVDEGLWSNGNTSSLNVDGLSVGSYAYRINAYDLNNNTSFRDIILYVKVFILLTISSPADQLIEEGSTGNLITWNTNGSDGNYYFIRLNGSFFYAGFLIGQSEIIVEIDDLTIGTYEFMIILNQDEQRVNNTVIITVIDTTSPEITNPSDLIYEEDSLGNVISWMGSDNNPKNYIVAVDDLELEQGLWISGTPILINVDGFSSGSYTFSITLYDNHGNFVTDDVVLTVKKDTELNLTVSDETTGRETTNFSAPFSNFYFILISIIVFALLTKRRKLDCK